MVVLLGTPVLADEYLVYTDLGIPGESDIYTWCYETGDPLFLPNCGFAGLNACGTPEGTNYFRTPSLEWAGFGIFHLNAGVFPRYEDLSGFLGGSVNFWVRTAHDISVELQCVPDPGSSSFAVTYAAGPLANYGWDGTPTWQEMVIPISDFSTGGGGPPGSGSPDGTCLAYVYSAFMATGVNTPVDFEIDYVRWTTPNTHSGATQVDVQGRELLVNGEPFVVNGVAYNPISIGENFTGALRDRPDRYLVDFPLMADAGINTVRIYNTFLNTPMLDAASANGLFVIPTFGVDPTMFACPTGRQFIQDRFVDRVSELKDHPAILMWLVGNEVNINVATASLCDATVGWFPNLDAMAEAAHLAEDPTYPVGNSYHPVITGNAEVTDICVPGCSDDTAMQHLDIWGTQVYRGCNQLDNVFADYGAKGDCSKPLIVTEFGADSWDSLSGASGAENQPMQDACMDIMLGAADAALAIRDSVNGVSAGQVIFSWADEWWKAECDPETSWTAHDTCTTFTEVGYPDPAMNEEWWGIVAVSDADPLARNLRAVTTTVGDSYKPGTACNVNVDNYDAVSGNTTISFDSAAGSTDHTIHYGPLSAVSTYGYSGELTGLGADGSTSLTLPGGSLFWLVVGRNSGVEGGYGTGTAERPANPGASVPQDPNRTAVCTGS